MFKYNELNFKFQDDFTCFIKYFVQRYPSYCVKFPGNPWKTKKKPLSDRPIKSHLSYKYYVGTLAQWYPPFAILDIDDVSNSQVNHLRELLNLNSNNSMLCRSESPNSYHILLKPLYKNKPPTVKLLNSVFRIFSLIHNIEIFPKSNKVIRLPFGLNQDLIDESYYPLNQEDWTRKLYLFQKLDDYDLSSVAHHQLILDLDYKIPESDKILTPLQEGSILYEHGLQIPSSRHESQSKVLYYLMRSNIPLDVSINMTFKWLRKKHNGFSKDYPRYPQLCKQEIIRQAVYIYKHYPSLNIYPDSTHNIYYGFISESDLRSIIDICSGNMPRINFLYNLVRYINPRRHRDFVNVHTDKLISWASNRTYLKYLNEFEQKGILSRGTAYMERFFSKAIILNWNFSPPNYAILNDGRSLNHPYNAIKLTFSASEFGQLLKNHRQDYSNIMNIIKDIYVDRQVI